MTIKAIIASEFNPKGIRDAQAEFRKFRKSLSEVEGATNKLKFGFDAGTKAFTNFTTSAGGLSGIITTYGTVAIRAANETAQLAKAAIDLSEATGLSVEQASRWIAVGEDFQVEAASLQQGLSRVVKTLDSGTWERYGIATRTASGEVRGANEILIDALAVLSETTNKTERASIAFDFFGKGFGNIAPLLGKTRTQYQQMLDAVESGQVITAEEAKQTEEWRMAQDKLNDAWREFTLQLGKSTTSMAPVVDGLAEILHLVQTINETPILSDIVEAFERAVNPISNVANLWADTKELFSDTSEVDETARAMGGLAYNTEESERAYLQWQAAVGGIERVMGGLYGMTADQRDMYLEYQEAREEAAGADERGLDALRQTTTEFRRQANHMRDLLGLREELYASERDALERSRDFIDAQSEFNAILDDSEASTEDQVDAAIKLSEEYATLEGASLNSANGTIRQIQHLSDLQSTMKPGSALWKAIQDYILALRSIPTNVRTTLALSATSDNPRLLQQVRGVSGALASGGPVASGKTYLVGEEGPELFTPSMSGMIIPNDKLVSGAVSGSYAAGGAVNLYVTVTNPVASGEQLANELAAYTRRNGTRWLAGVV